MDKIRLGAVISSPVIPEIWWGLSQHYKEYGIMIEMVYHDSYIPQIQKFLKNEIDITWNGPLGFNAIRYFCNDMQLNGPMRNTDFDVSSVFLVRSGSHITTISDLRGKIVGTGSFDSVESRIVPLYFLYKNGLKHEVDFKEISFNVNTSNQLYGTYNTAELNAVKALVSGDVDVAVCYENRLKNWISNGDISEEEIQILTQTPRYSHCIFAGNPNMDHDLFNRFFDATLEMVGSNSIIQKAMELENVQSWKAPDIGGFDQILNGAKLLKIFEKGEYASIEFNKKM